MSGTNCSLFCHILVSLLSPRPEDYNKKISFSSLLLFTKVLPFVYVLFIIIICTFFLINQKT